MIFTPWEPDPKAVARVVDPVPPIKVCQYCGEKVVITVNAEMYGRNYGEWPWIYLCRSCHSYVGMHPYTGIPLGILADRETREVRKKCKKKFMELYKFNGLTRSEAYEILARTMNIETKDCHFGMFTPEYCERAYTAVEKIITSLGTNKRRGDAHGK